MTFFARQIHFCETKGLIAFCPPNLLCKRNFDDDFVRKETGFLKQVTTFADLGLSPAILKAIEERGYTTPTPIQEQAIPYVLQTRDLLGCAQTGTGKTAGFTLPMIEILAQGRARARMPRSLIWPTRELPRKSLKASAFTANTIRSSAWRFSSAAKTWEPQIKTSTAWMFWIATPGRMIDLFDRGKILPSTTSKFFAVIDEADRMLDMGFIPDVEKIAGLLPPLRQTLSFRPQCRRKSRNWANRFSGTPRASASRLPPAQPITSRKS